jgi:hypothetical protein
VENWREMQLNLTTLFLKKLVWPGKNNFDIKNDFFCSQLQKKSINLRPIFKNSDFFPL